MVNVVVLEVGSKACTIHHFYSTVNSDLCCPLSPVCIHMTYCVMHCHMYMFVSNWHGRAESSYYRLWSAKGIPPGPYRPGHLAKAGFVTDFFAMLHLPLLMYTEH